MSRGFIWVLILNRIRLIAAYPLNGLSYLLILPVSFLIFGETVTPVRLMSSIMISSGVILLTFGELLASGKIKTDQRGRKLI